MMPNHRTDVLLSEHLFCSVLPNSGVPGDNQNAFLRGKRRSSTQIRVSLPEGFSEVTAVLSSHAALHPGCAGFARQR